MAARKSPKSKAKRRPQHDGGLYEKQKKTRDPAWLDTNHPTLSVRQQLARYADGSGWYIKEATKTKKEPRRARRATWLKGARCRRWAPAP